MSLASKSSLHAIVKIFSNVLKPHSNVPTPLGRWKVCENKNINLVVDYSNEDHCGTCSSHSLNNEIHSNIINKTLVTHQKESVVIDNDLYSYDYICLMSNNQEK